MYTFYVSLSSIGDVKQFVAADNNCPCEVDVLSDRYVINAKSIMGLFSLDLTHPVKVQTHGTDEQGKSFRSSVDPFVTQDGE